MKSRWILAGVLGLVTLASVAMVVVTWGGADGGRWIFVVFAVFFAVLTAAAAVPPKPRKPVEPEKLTGTRFVPVWFFDGAILLLGVLMLLAIGSCVFGRK